MIIFKNFFSFVLTFFAYDWLIDGGIQRTLVAISLVQVGVCLLSIPMCKSYVSLLFTSLSLTAKTCMESDAEHSFTFMTFSPSQNFDERLLLGQGVPFVTVLLRILSSLSSEHTSE